MYVADKERTGRARLSSAWAHGPENLHPRTPTQAVGVGRFTHEMICSLFLDIKQTSLLLFVVYLCQCKQTEYS